MAGFAVLSLLGGLTSVPGLLTEVNWRLTLLVPAPVALIVLAAGWRLIPRDTRDESSAATARRPFDLPGAPTVSLSTPSGLALPR